MSICHQVHDRTHLHVLIKHSNHEFNEWLFFYWGPLFNCHGLVAHICVDLTSIKVLTDVLGSFIMARKAIKMEGGCATANNYSM